MQNIASIRDADVAGKRVLVCVDFNVPLQDRAVQSDLRLKSVLPTLELLHQKGAASIVLLSHLGRPEGKVVETLRMAPVEARLRELTAVPFTMHENLRFDPREEANDPAFAAELAGLGDVYVNEAFSNSHRLHASIVGVPKLLPSYIGLRFEEEITKLQSALTPPPGSLAIIGGAKFETKAPLIKKLLPLYDGIMLGGALANDILKARGMPFGNSLISSLPVPPEIAESEKLVIPADAILGQDGANTERSAMVVDIRMGESVIDIGPATSLAWSKRIAEAPFVLWNGPMGIYEQGFRDGTDQVAAALAASSARAVVGGGDTAAAVAKHAFDPDRVFVSTGGGAMLQFLADGTLPGLEALKK